MEKSDVPFKKEIIYILPKNKKRIHLWKIRQYSTNVKTTKSDGDGDGFAIKKYRQQ